MTFSSASNKTEIDFVLVGRQNRKFLKDVKAIPGELQHRLVIVDVDQRKLRRIVRKRMIEKRKVWKLKEEETRAKFQERVEELVDMDAPDMWKSFKEGVLRACDEVCGKTRGRKDQGGETWWWSNDVKEAVTKKKDAFKEYCKNRTEELKAKYKELNKQAKKVVAKAKEEGTEQLLCKFGKDRNGYSI